MRLSKMRPDVWVGFECGLRRKVNLSSALVLSLKRSSLPWASPFRFASHDLVLCGGLRRRRSAPAAHPQGGPWSSRHYKEPVGLVSGPTPAASWAGGGRRVENWRYG